AVVFCSQIATFFCKINLIDNFAIVRVEQIHRAQPHKQNQVIFYQMVGIKPSRISGFKAPELFTSTFIKLYNPPTVRKKDRFVKLVGTVIAGIAYRIESIPTITGNTPEFIKIIIIGGNYIWLSTSRPITNTDNVF